MTPEIIASSLRQFMARSFEGRTIADDDDIFAAGFANSLFAMQLVAFVEREFGVEIGSEDLDMDNFRSVQAIAALVGRKLTSADA
jgi:methoxymalonate biosynthesis acyl carrier protein